MAAGVGFHWLRLPSNASLPERPNVMPCAVRAQSPFLLSFGGFLGLGSEEYTLSWNKLDYDTSLGGFRTDITEDQIRGAPNFYRDRDYDWSDRQRERELHDYWKAPYYWGI